MSREKFKKNEKRVEGQQREGKMQMKFVGGRTKKGRRTGRRGRLRM